MVSVGNFDIKKTLNADYPTHTYDVSNFSIFHLLINASENSLCGLYWSSESPYTTYYPDFFAINQGEPFFKVVKIKGKYLNIVYSTVDYPVNITASALFYK